MEEKQNTHRTLSPIINVTNGLEAITNKAKYVFSVVRVGVMESTNFATNSTAIVSNLLHITYLDELSNTVHVGGQNLDSKSIAWLKTLKEGHTYTYPDSFTNIGSVAR